jgi:alpha-ketoglutarate-dependent taurine dioxygenase
MDYLNEGRAWRPEPTGGSLMALQHVTRTATVDEVAACVREHGVMLVRGLDLTSQQHVELTRVFGVPDIHPIEKIRLPEQPEVIVLAQAPLANDAPDDPAGEEPVGAIAWHSDLTYTALPSRGALLYARVVPEEGGVRAGSTPRPSMMPSLSPRRRRSRGLDELRTFATQSQFAYFHPWRVGDLVLWDNWRTMHVATGHKRRFTRVMHRTTLRGGESLMGGEHNG